MTTLRAVIFDLDDTLYPERDYVLSGFRAVAQWAQRELGVCYEEGYTRFERLYGEGVRGTTFNQWLREAGFPEEPWVAEMVRVYRCHQPDIQPFECVPALLERLGQRYDLGLISDGYLQVQQKSGARWGSKRILRRWSFPTRADVNAGSLRPGPIGKRYSASAARLMRPSMWEITCSRTSREPTSSAWARSTCFAPRASTPIARPPMPNQRPWRPFPLSQRSSHYSNAGHRTRTRRALP